MKHQILSALFLLVSLINVAEAQPIKFLEEKTAFCYSEKALAKYLQAASKRDIHGMNNLMLKGKCDFVPDGEIVHLKNYRIDEIGKMKIVEFEFKDQNLWTVKRLVQTADFSDM